MTKPLVLILEWLPDGALARLESRFPEIRLAEARTDELRSRMIKEAVIAYGLPRVPMLADAVHLRWIQLISAGVPLDLCPVAKDQKLVITNLAGLYGPAIAEHAIDMMLALSRSLHLAMHQQVERRWDRGLAHAMKDLHGRTLAVLGLGNIGQNIARLGRAHGLRVIGCRRTPRPTPYVDRLYPRSELLSMLSEADVLAVAAPLTAETQGMLGPTEFPALKQGALYINISRGGIAQESALIDALRSGRIAAAGLDVFAVEPLPQEHPFWTMPQVLISPHVSGETVNLSSLPVERFSRNVASWLEGAEMEGRVNVGLGY